jgi:hypothetical protein
VKKERVGVKCDFMKKMGSFWREAGQLKKKEWSSVVLKFRCSHKLIFFR